MLASPPGSTVDFEATNFSLDPLPSWRSMGFVSTQSGASTSNEPRHSTSGNYDFSSLILRHSQQQQSADLALSGSLDANNPEMDQPFNAGEEPPFSCTYEDASPLNWTQSN